MIGLKMQSHPPLLSLIVPCHNHAGADRRAMLGALLACLPDRNDLEVLLVDDHSSLAYAPPEFRYLHLRQMALPAGQTHAGAARNHGISLAMGEWLGFVDSDDLVNSTGLLELLDGLAQGIWQDADLVVVRAWSFLDDDPQLPANRHLFVNRWIERAANDEPSAIVRVPSCWIRIVRRSFVHRHGLRFGCTAVAEDLDFAVDLGLTRPRIAFAAFVLAEVRAGHASLTARLAAPALEEILQIKLIANARLRAGGLGAWEYPLLLDVLGLIRMSPGTGIGWLLRLLKARARLFPTLREVGRAIKARITA